MLWLSHIGRIEAQLDTKIEEIHVRRFEALKARLEVCEGPIEPAKGRSRVDAVRGSMHSFPYMLWTVRRQIWREEAFRVELACLSLGLILGWFRGFMAIEWVLLIVLGVAALLAEANNTASEMKFRHFQHLHFGGTKLDIDIGDMFEFAALPVAMCAWPWGIMWLIFMVWPR